MLPVGLLGLPVLLRSGPRRGQSKIILLSDANNFTFMLQLPHHWPVHAQAIPHVKQSYRKSAMPTDPDAQVFLDKSHIEVPRPRGRRPVEFGRLQAG